MLRPIHFEIQADDPVRAIKFYQSSSLDVYQVDGPMPYWLVTTGSDGTPGINGGLHPRVALEHSRSRRSSLLSARSRIERLISSRPSRTGRRPHRHAQTAIPESAGSATPRTPRANIFGMIENDPRRSNRAAVAGRRPRLQELHVRGGRRRFPHRYDNSGAGAFARDMGAPIGCSGVQRVPNAAHHAVFSRRA